MAAIGLSWAVTISPPKATRAIIRYMSQNRPVLSISPGVRLTADCGTRVFPPARSRPAGVQLAAGAVMNWAATRTTTAWTAPHTMNAAR